MTALDQFWLTLVIEIIVVANAIADGLMMRMLAGKEMSFVTLSNRWRIEGVLASLPHEIHRWLPEWTDLQWAWHLAKWIHFYLPLGLLLKLGEFDRFSVTLIAAGSVFIWKTIYGKVKPQ